MSCTVRTVADVEAVARAHGLSVTDHGVSPVHGQWSGPGVVLTATEDAKGWVRCSVQSRDARDRLVCTSRFEGSAEVEWIHDVVAWALARHQRSARAA